MAENSEVIEIFEESPATEEEDSVLLEKYEEIKKRCSVAKIEFQQNKPEEWESGATLTISFPSGRLKRDAHVYSIDSADRILNIEFEKFKFLNGFEAIYCIDRKYVEIGLSTTSFNVVSLLNRLKGKYGLLDSADTQPVRILPPDSLAGQPEIAIGPPSVEFSVLCNDRGAAATLKLYEVNETQHDKVVDKVVSVSNSLFFQIDMLHGATFIIVRRRPRRIVRYRGRLGAEQIEYPVAQFNQDAISLYWYAKTARNMPLLQFLALYQCVEYYFSRYSQVEARKRIKLILKRPTFRPHRDDDLDQIISVLQSSRGGGLGGERAQLRAVVNECLSAEEVRAYFEGTKDRQEHFSGKGSRQKFHKIPVQNQSADLRNDTADRVYDIRCKIVHTKSENGDDEIGMLLPFSEEAEYLQPDIDLVEFIARSVLVASSESIA